MQRCHQGVVKKRSGLGDSFPACGGNLEETNNNNNNNRYPLCPKPRRLQPSPMPEFLKPLACTKHSHLATVTDAKKVGILSLIPEREREKCSNCWGYSGSPPGRTGNPLVQDVRFIREQMDLLSHLPRADQFAFAPSASASPV